MQFGIYSQVPWPSLMFPTKMKNPSMRFMALNDSPTIFATSIASLTAKITPLSPSRIIYFTRESREQEDASAIKRANERCLSQIQLTSRNLSKEKDPRLTFPLSPSSFHTILHLPSSQILCHTSPPGSTLVHDILRLKKKRQELSTLKNGLIGFIFI